MKHPVLVFCVAIIYAQLLPGHLFGQGQFQETDPVEFHTGEAVYEAGPDMSAPRLWHHALLLPNGNVALVGGITYNFVSLGTADIFDPATNSFASTSMVHTHASPAVTRLLDGTYLIAGGSGDLGVPRYAESEIFDPVNLTFTHVGNMARFRSNGGAATLPDGKVVVAGAWWTHNDAHTYGEIYDPVAGTFSGIGPFTVSRSTVIVIPTSDGKAMIIGGVTPRGVWENMPVELFDPSTGEVAVHQSSLFPDDEGWTILNSETYTEAQKLTDGTYLWMAMKWIDQAYGFKLVIIDPESMEWEVFETGTGLPDSQAYSFLGQPVIDHDHNRAYLVAMVTDADPCQIAVFTVDLETGSLTKSSNYHEMTDYMLRNVPAVLLGDGRIFLSGGSVSNNFDAVSRTLFITPPEPIDVSSVPAAELPGSIILHQNYPNPFNPATLIGYELPEGGDIRLDVYDITGKRVAVLFEGYRSPGSYSVQFDAGGLASGIYICQLAAKDQVLTQKMTIMK